jgi:hypothetical protein
MKVQTGRELDLKKKEQGRLHKLSILKNAGASRKPRSISIGSTGDTMEERENSGAAVHISRAIEVSFLRRTQILQ